MRLLLVLIALISLLVLSASASTPAEFIFDTSDLNEKDQDTRNAMLSNLKVTLDMDMVRSHYGIPKDMKLPIKPKRVANITPEEFVDYAKRGVPLIITDIMTRWPAWKKWTCEYFPKAFPNEKVDGFTAARDDAFFYNNSMGDFKKFFSRKEKTYYGKHEKDKKNPKIVSWYYSAIGTDGTKGIYKKRNMTVVDSLLADYSVPYFMKDNKLNRKTIKSRLEFFFGQKEAGVHPHTDPICQWIFSGQAAGAKSWRLTLPFSIPRLEKENPGYKFNTGDVQQLLALMMKNHCIYDFTLQAGEMFFFPPGMMHSTKGALEECSLSFSLQFSDPHATTYIMKFHEYLLSDLAGTSKTDIIGPAYCFLDNYNRWMLLNRYPNKNPNAVENKKYVDKVWPQIDTDNSGFISKKEALDFFYKVHLAKVNKESDSGTVFSTLEEAEKHHGRKFHRVSHETSHDSDADSFMLVHDPNNTGKVSKEMFLKGVNKYWNNLNHKVSSHYSARRNIQFFSQADKDVNNQLTQEELTEEYKLLDFDKDLKKYDNNSDGMLSLSEFEKNEQEIISLFKAVRIRSKSQEFQAATEEENIASVSNYNKLLSIMEDQKANRSKVLEALTIRIEDLKIRSLWNIPNKTKFPLEPRRIEKLTVDQFRKFAERGEPVIVTGLLAKNHPWTCEYFSKEFPFESVHKVNWNATTLKLGEMKDFKSEKFSWQYHALGENTDGDNEYARNATIVEMLGKGYILPSFAPQSEVNKLLKKDSLEFFFATKGADTLGLADTICHWNYYAMTHGSKRWKISLPFSTKQLQEENPGYEFEPDDSQILRMRMLKSHAIYDFVLKEGEILIIPPGLFKRHQVVSEGCSSMYRSRFFDPVFAKYVSTYQQQLMSDGDGAAGCFTDHYNLWFFGTLLPEGDGSITNSIENAKKMFKKIDTDKDGVITEQEVTKHMPEKATEGAIRTPELDATAFMVINDQDKDGKVSLQDLIKTYLKHWSPTYKEISSMWHWIDDLNSEEGGFSEYDSLVSSIRYDWQRKAARNISVLLDIPDEFANLGLDEEEGEYFEDEAAFKV